VVIQNRKLQVALRAQKQTEQQLTVTLNDKETLIRELYHRTNNNMQVIQGLLRSRMSAHPDLPLAEFVDDVIGQLQSMSQAQQQLFRGEHLSRIDLAEYLQSLVQVARDRYPDQRSKIAFLFHLQSVPILIDSAVPVGLVVYELVTNAVRHAFTGEPDEWESKEIDVTCDFTEADEIEIRISDNGLRWGPDPERTRSIGGGLGLATALVEQQLRGTIEFDDSVGTTCIVRFRDDQYEERV
jgi:two-component sensor histidine kinase